MYLYRLLYTDILNAAKKGGTHMKKKQLVGYSILLAGLCAAAYIIKEKSEQLPVLTGKLLIQTDSAYSDIYDLSTKTFEGHKISQFNAKMLGGTPYVFSGYYGFERYDTRNKTVISIETNNDDHIENIVPVSEDTIYYLQNEEIREYRFESCSKTVLPDETVYYFDYNINTKDIYYQSPFGIFQYNEDTKLTSRIAEFCRDPKISPDNLHLAYSQLRGAPKTLFVQDMNNGKINSITVDTNIISYCFSPDSQYIAIYKPESVKINLKFKYNSYEIILWDYKNDKTYLLADDFDKICNIDWKN